MLLPSSLSNPSSLRPSFYYYIVELPSLVIPGKKLGRENFIPSTRRTGAQMPTVIDPRLSQPHRIHGSSFAADERRVRRLGALIFAELLPQSTAGIATVLSPFRPRSSSSDAGWLQPGGVSSPGNTATRNPLALVRRAGKEIPLMKAY